MEKRFIPGHQYCLPNSGQFKKGHTRTPHGEKSPHYKDGKTCKSNKFYCVDCGAQVSNGNYTRCRPCNFEWRKTQPNKGAFKKGNISPTTGKKRSQATRDKISKTRKQRIAEGLIVPWSKGKKLEYMAGENNHNWRGGKSVEPYAWGWREELKEDIRKRDGRTCQVCHLPEESIPMRLTVHHIDYDKTNLVGENLISLCNRCHGATNYNRPYWQSVLEEKLVRRGYRAASTGS